MDVCRKCFLQLLQSAIISRRPEPRRNPPERLPDSFWCCMVQQLSSGSDAHVLYRDSKIASWHCVDYSSAFVLDDNCCCLLFFRVAILFLFILSCVGPRKDWTDQLRQPFPSLKTCILLSQSAEFRGGLDLQRSRELDRDAHAMQSQMRSKRLEAACLGKSNRAIMLTRTCKNAKAVGFDFIFGLKKFEGWAI